MQIAFLECHLFMVVVSIPMFLFFFQCFYFYCSKLYQSFPLWVIGKALYFLFFFCSIYRCHAFSVQFISVTQSCMTVCYPMDCSTPGFPVRQQLLELTQTQVHRVSDAIKPSHPLSSPSPPAFNLAQHQGLSQWVTSSHQVAKILEFQLQHQSFQWIFRTDLLWIDWLDLFQVQGTLQVFSNITVSILRCSAFFVVQLSHPYMTTGRTIALTRWTCVSKVMSL